MELFKVNTDLQSVIRISGHLQTHTPQHTIKRGGKMVS